MGMSRDFEGSSSPEATALVILDTETESNAIPIAGFAWIRLYFPTGFDGTVYSIEVSEDGTNFFAPLDSQGSGGDPITLTPTADEAYRIDLAFPARWLRVVSDTEEDGDYAIPYTLAG